MFVPLFDPAFSLPLSKHNKRTQAHTQHTDLCFTALYKESHFDETIDFRKREIVQHVVEYCAVGGRNAPPTHTYIHTLEVFKSS